MRRVFNDDLLVSRHALSRYEAEADGAEWAAVLGTCRGRKIEVITSRATSPGLDPAQAMFAHDVAARLNRELDHDGAWVILLTHRTAISPLVIINATQEFKRFCMIWMDADGDIQFTVENDDPLWMVLSQGIHHWMDQAEGAWRQWKHLMRDVLAPSSDQMTTRVI